MKKYSKAYQNYRNKFYAEKKIGNVKNGVRVLTARQYRNATLGTNQKGYRDSKYAMTDKQILKAQTILATKAEKKRAWQDYKKIKKTFSRGNSLERIDNLFGKEDMILETELKYHYNLSGLLKDRNALHFLISERIDQGENREEVLADYGY